MAKQTPALDIRRGVHAAFLARQALGQSQFVPGTADVVATMQIVMEGTGESPDTLDRVDG